jgi:uncharacterized protein (DUF3084 family)
MSLSLTESMLIAKNRNLVADADAKMTLLENEIGRLNVILQQKDQAISQRDALLRAQTEQAKADACSIAGYRAYVEYVRTVCEDDVLEKAVDVYLNAANAKADELKVPHLKRQKAD